jgi:hypothetical protein
MTGLLLLFELTFYVRNIGISEVLWWRINLFIYFCHTPLITL